jgi:hypothetical protein
MAPRIIRAGPARHALPLALALGLGATAGGYAAARAALARVLGRTHESPRAVANDREETVAGGDAGTPPTHSSSPAVQSPHEPRVAARVTRVDLVSCGDGDELDTPGERCDASPEVERALRSALERLGDCPAALIAGQNPAQVLSIGLRVDFARRQVVPGQGRASSVRDPLSFVGCARQRGAMGSLDALFGLRHGKARYQYVAAMRFGPLGPSALAALDAGASAPTIDPRDAGVSVRADAMTRSQLPADDPALALPVTVFMGTALPRPEPSTVTWSRALIRNEPRTGVVMTRIPFGTRVTIEARNGNWFRVRWASGMGWVYGEAIGRGVSDAGVSG